MAEKTVLFVEDNPDDVELTLMAFKAEGFPYPVVVAEDGQEALDYLFGRGTRAGRDPSDAPALVILDLKMPKVGGLEVLKALREHPALGGVPAAILTTSDEEQDRSAAAALGADLYLQKPTGFAELRRIVAELRRLVERP